MDVNDETRIGLAGDWHGSDVWMLYALHTFGQAGIKTVFQLGDFSLGWPGKWPDLINIAESVCKQYDMRLYVVPGNHENWEWINSRPWDDESDTFEMTPHTYILRRNALFDLYYQDEDDQAAVRTVLALGGAPSIDFEWRTQGINWWREEMISLREAETAAKHQVDIMLAHDSPDGGTSRVQWIIDSPQSKSMWSAAGLAYAKEGRMLMNRAVYGDNDQLPGAQPKVFAHGHFHVADTRQDENTLWLSLACNGMENNLGTLDLKTLEFDWLELVMELPE